MASEPKIVVPLQSKNEQLIERQATVCASRAKSSGDQVVIPLGLREPFRFKASLKFRELL